ncbi:probable tyrosyl-DNA phosphodiesterase [Fopius arisanus]|uniref:Gkt protein n=1 Tax=Fopius arisanus TaxID=64838 RepID=A0A0C9R1Q8_9HYME|nr:PREDICTED: probable tyrosyl-DNA phosphodiesterase [Fopius arisanus]
MNSPPSGGYNSQSTKQICPFSEKCYRKNPVHFSEMSHPHLEELVKDLDDAVEVPEVLSFECRDKSLLLDQLRIVQMLMRKERGLLPLSNGRCSQFSQSPGRAPHSQNLHNLPTKHENSSSPSSTLQTSPGPSTKREINSPDTATPKRPRQLPKSQSPPQSSVSSQGSTISESPGLSIIQKYVNCTSQQARRDFRSKAVNRMRQENQEIPYIGSKGEFDMKYALSSPYFVFLTAVQNSPETWNQPYSVTFPEILDVSLGEIEESLHINFMVDVGWLCLQYLLACQSPKMLVLLGQRCDTESLPDIIKVVKVEPPSKYGTHHTKISVLKYTNGVRVIVSTANLYHDDWDNRTQALWISPHLPELPEGSSKAQGDSKTGFKTDFLNYLTFYGPNRIQHWLDVLERCDFSSIDVFFLASVPGNHKEGSRDRWGLRRLAALLSSHAQLPADGAKWSVVAQCSSIGSLGPNFESWVGKDVLTTLSSETTKGLRSTPKFQFIYPTVENYKQSFDMRVGSCCLPYSNQLNAKQTWLSNYSHQWKAGDKCRTQAMPHIKSYTRISPDFKRIPWVVITSANLSKAAWGWGGKATNTILSYEAGVVFFPKFVTNSTTFPIREPDETGTPPFPLPYDVPLTPYGPQDKIFTMDFFSE